MVQANTKDIEAWEWGLDFDSFIVMGVFAYFQGSGCGSVGRAVGSRGLRFEFSH